jgi:hypothetical protein
MLACSSQTTVRLGFSESIHGAAKFALALENFIANAA